MKEIIKYLEIKGKENMTYQISWQATKVVLSGKTYE